MLKVGQKRSKEKSALAAEPYRAHDYSRQNPLVPKSLKEFQGRTTTRNGWPKLKGKYPGGMYGEMALRFTNVFVRRDGRWQLVLSHSTPVKAK
jgi:hypothetical protein